MRTGSSDVRSLGRGGRGRVETRLKKARKTRNQFFDMEGLESRTLLATTPAAAYNGALIRPHGYCDRDHGRQCKQPDGRD